MKRLFKFGTIGMAVGIGLLCIGILSGGFGPCSGSLAGFVGLIAGFWCSVAAAAVLVISGPALLVRKLRTQEVTDEGTF
jgi:hypothetical protein